MAKRLLIVDDDADAAAGLAAALDLRSGGDWEIDIATSSLSALAQLKVRPADVVIASLRLGGGGGDGLLATIGGFVSGTSALSFVVAANVLDSASGPREGRGDPVPLTARLKTVLEPLGLAQHAGRWLDWTIESTRSAA